MSRKLLSVKVNLFVKMVILFRYSVSFGKCKGKGCKRRRFFFNAFNISIYENDIAILKVKNPENLNCEQKKIWPACLPNEVCKILQRYFRFSDMR